MARHRYRACVFCDKTDSPPSKEDVFAKWIAREWPGGRFEIATGNIGENPDRTWQQVGTMGIVVSAPCERCNNGWMSDLEGAVKPVLSSLLAGELQTLRDVDQLVLTRWLLKTTMMYEFFRARSPRFFHPTDRQRFYESREIPAGTMMWVGHYSGGEDGWFFDLDVPIKLEEGSGTVFGDAYVTTFALGRVALQLFSHRWKTRPVTPTSTFKVPGGEWRRQLHQIWPLRLADRPWPPGVTLNHEALEMLARVWLDLRP